MHSAIFSTFGPPSVVEYREVPTPDPGPGEVLIQVAAAAMNHLDLWVRRGLPIETTMPHIGGSDVAGTIATLGEGVTGFTPGERVVVNPALSCGVCRECARGEESLCPRFRILGEHTDGGFADFLVAPAANVYAIPDHVSFGTAACLPVSYQTAWRAIVSRALVRPGEDVLVIGASGGTALAAVQVARLAGARVFALTSGPENVERVAGLGADHVIDREKGDFAASVLDLTDGRGVDVVVENVGEPTWDRSVRCLASGGRLVTYGATGGPAVSVDVRRLFWRQLSLIGTTMASRSEFEDVIRAAWAGRIVPVVDSVYPLAQARIAHQRLEEGGQFGKIILEP